MSSATQTPLSVVDLGTIPFSEGVEVQDSFVAKRLRGEVPDTLLLVEHPPVLTKGRRTDAGDLGMDEDWYRARGIDVVEVDRGGRVTYHGPGQSVIYPIVDLRSLGSDRRANVRDYVGTLERGMIAALAGYGIATQVFSGLTGVWTAGEPPVPIGEPGPERTPIAAPDSNLAATRDRAKKIGSIGIHVTRGVTSHGLAVNVTNDLRPFEWVVPCGIDSAEVTSVARELEGRGTQPPSANDFSRALASSLSAALHD